MAFLYFQEDAFFLPVNRHPVFQLNIKQTQNYITINRGTAAIFDTK